MSGNSGGGAGAGAGAAGNESGFFGTLPDINVFHGLSVVPGNSDVDKIVLGVEHEKRIFDTILAYELPHLEFKQAPDPAVPELVDVPTALLDPVGDGDGAGAGAGAGAASKNLKGLFNYMLPETLSELLTDGSRASLREYTDSTECLRQLRLNSFHELAKRLNRQPRQAALRNMVEDTLPWYGPRTTKAARAKRDSRGGGLAYVGKICGDIKDEGKVGRPDLKYVLLKYEMVLRKESMFGQPLAPNANLLQIPAVATAHFKAVLDAKNYRAALASAPTVKQLAVAIKASMHTYYRVETNNKYDDLKAERATTLQEYCTRIISNSEKQPERLCCALDFNPEYKSFGYITQYTDWRTSAAAARPQMLPPFGTDDDGANPLGVIDETTLGLANLRLQMAKMYTYTVFAGDIKGGWTMPRLEDTVWMKKDATRHVGHKHQYVPWFIGFMCIPEEEPLNRGVAGLTQLKREANPAIDAMNIRENIDVSWKPSNDRDLWIPILSPQMMGLMNEREDPMSVYDDEAYTDIDEFRVMVNAIWVFMNGLVDHTPPRPTTDAKRKAKKQLGVAEHAEARKRKKTMAQIARKAVQAVAQTDTGQPPPGPPPTLLPKAPEVAATTDFFNDAFFNGANLLGGGGAAAAGGWKYHDGNQRAADNLLGGVGGGGGAGAAAVTTIATDLASLPGSSFMGDDEGDSLMRALDSDYNDNADE